MAIYKYSGFKKDGKPIKGVKESSSKQQLLTELTSKGIFISEIKESTKTKQLFRKKFDLADQFFQLSLLLDSGIPLMEGLRIIASTTKVPDHQNFLYTVSSKISEGVKFSEALTSFPEYVDPMYTNLIKASEKIGRLPEVLMDVAEYEEVKKDNADKLKAALTYPIVIMVIGMGILTFLLAVIVPKIQKIFSQVKKEIPTVTKVLLALSDFVRTYGLVLLGFALLALFLFHRYYKTNPRFREKVDERLFKVQILSQSSIARFVHILAFQLREGLPLTDALFYANQTVNNVFLKKNLETIRTQVQEGVRFSTSIKNTGIFPELFGAAVTTGESAGNMPELLERVSTFYNKEIDRYTKSFLSIVEPLSIVIVGSMVAFVVIAIMVPLFDISAMT